LKKFGNENVKRFFIPVWSILNGKVRENRIWHEPIDSAFMKNKIFKGMSLSSIKWIHRVTGKTYLPILLMNL
jgi:hypothetical protein